MEVVLSVKGTGEMKSEVIDLNYCFIYCLTLGKHLGLNLLICPITSWEIDGETVETVSDFILGGSKITVDGDCSHEIKRHLFLGRKAMTNLDSILKGRDITLPTKVRLVKAMVFSSSHVWM